MDGVPTAIVSDGNRLEYNVTPEIRIAYLAMRIGEACAHGVNGDMAKCLATIQYAAKYIHESACAQENYK